MIALRQQDQNVWNPRPLPHETEAETKTNHCETETETKIKKWSRDHAALETLSTVGPVKMIEGDIATSNATDTESVHHYN